MIRAEHLVRAHVQAVVGMQVADQHRIDVLARGIPLQGAERAVAEIDKQLESVSGDEVAGGRAGRTRETARASHDGQVHSSLMLRAGELDLAEPNIYPECLKGGMIPACGDDAQGAKAPGRPE